MLVTPIAIWPASDQEGHADRVFEGLDAAAKAGLTDVQRLRGPSEIAVFNGSQEMP